MITVKPKIAAVKRWAAVLDKRAGGYLISFALLLSAAGLEGLNHIYFRMPAGKFVMTGCILVTLQQILTGICYFITVRKRRERTLEREKERTQAEFRKAIRQIRPHFIFNTLNAIGAVSLTEPEVADISITRFSNYLRTKLMILENCKFIPFDMELKNIENYIQLEQLRFGGRIGLILKASCTDFSVPLLSIQAFVENAIEYGVSKRREGGHVIIYTDRQDDTVEITIEDDGIGFDTSIKKENVNAVRFESAFREMNMYGSARTIVESTPGGGTTVRIRLTLPVTI